MEVEPESKQKEQAIPDSKNKNKPVKVMKKSNLWTDVYAPKFPSQIIGN